MTDFQSDWEARQRARWLRPDASRYIRSDFKRYLQSDYERRFLPPGLDKKYSPDQPRDERGRWTDAEGGSSAEQSNSDVDEILAWGQRLIAAGRTPAYNQCLNMCSSLLERPKPYRWSDRNMYDFLNCMRECLKR